jgi:hypothetical protein
MIRSFAAIQGNCEQYRHTVLDALHGYYVSLRIYYENTQAYPSEPP